MYTALRCALSMGSQQCVYVEWCAHSSRCVYSTCICIAAVLPCVCVCRIRVRVRTCHTASPFPSAFLRYIYLIKSLPSPVYASFHMYVCVSSYGCASCNKCSCLSARYILRLKRNRCAHCHHAMPPSSPNSAVPCTGD